MGIQKYLDTADVSELSVAQPAAGAEFSQLVPVGQEWRLDSLYFRFVASAVVAGRFPRLVVTDPAGAIVAQTASPSVTATQTVLYSVGRGGSQQTGAVVNGTPYLLTWPDLWIPGGFTIKSNTINIDVGDQYSLINGLVSIAVV